MLRKVLSYPVVSIKKEVPAIFGPSMLKQYYRYNDTFQKQMFQDIQRHLFRGYKI